MREKESNVKIICIINQKGGIGKTSTVLTTGAVAASEGMKTLLVDMDIQRSLTIAAGAAPTLTTFDVLNGRPAEDAIIEVADHLDMIGGSTSLATITAGRGAEARLKTALEQMRGKYDLILIDTPPSLSVLTVSALYASEGVVIPALPDLLSFDAILELNKTIAAVRQKNRNLKTLGILFNNVRPTTYHADMIEAVTKRAETMNIPVFSTTIRQAISVQESQGERQLLTAFDPRGNVMNDYRSFYKELKERL